MCVVGWAPSGGLIHALVAALRDSGTDTARLITYTLFTVSLHIDAEFVASFFPSIVYFTFALVLFLSFSVPHL